MPLITLGLNHKTAPLSLREQLAFTPQNLPEALHSLKKLEAVDEAAILSTCNRTELYCLLNEGNGNSDQQLVDWFSRFHGMQSEAIHRYLYLYHHDDTIRHAMEVACGLDSMVLGEPQIVGQMKDAYALANEHGTLGRILGKLYERAFAVSKQVRTDTEIGANPVSVAFAATSLAKQIFGDLSDSTILLIGAGETIELTARHLHKQGVQHMIIANRSVERARQLAAEFENRNGPGEAIGLQHIGEHLHRCDVVIASTASPLPILGKGTVERALKKRRHEPIFMVDLAVPRDVEPEVGELDDVYLYTVDDLQSVIQENMASRQQAAEQAREIIDGQVAAFLAWQRSLGAVDIIADIRRHAQQQAREVLAKARKQLANGQEPERVLEFLSHTLTNKFLHQPSTRLRQASEDGQHDILELAQELFIGDTDNAPKTNKTDDKGQEPA